MDKQNKKYLFIFNSSKPSKEVYESKDDIVLNNFSIPNVEAALSLGYDVYIGINRKYAEELNCKNYPVKFYNANIFRNVLNFKDNIIAYKNLQKFLKKHEIDVIHCNTPLGGLFGRICGSKNNVQKILYTVHGFHFYKGNNFIKNFIFKRIERILAKKTDVIITINNEDYNQAKKFKMRNETNTVYKVNGVGINLDEIANNYKTDVLNNIRENGKNKIVVMTGDLTKNKNHKTAIKALKYINNHNVHLVIVGSGPEELKLKRLTHKLSLNKQVHFLGFRKDINDILKVSDVLLLTSYREGLSRSVMEAMANSLPVVLSKIRGNIDLIDIKSTNVFCNPKDYKCFGDKISTILEDYNYKVNLMNYNNKRIKKFDVNKIKGNILEIYRKEINDSN